MKYQLKLLYCYYTIAVSKWVYILSTHILWEHTITLHKKLRYSINDSVQLYIKQNIRCSISEKSNSKQLLESKLIKPLFKINFNCKSLYFSCALLLSQAVRTESVILLKSLTRFQIYRSQNDGIYPIKCFY